MLCRNEPLKFGPFANNAFIYSCKARQKNQSDQNHIQPINPERMTLYNSYLPPGASFAFSILASAEKKSFDIPINLIYFTAYE